MIVRIILYKYRLALFTYTFGNYQTITVNVVLIKACFLFSSLLSFVNKYSVACSRIKLVQFYNFFLSHHLKLFKTNSVTHSNFLRWRRKKRVLCECNHNKL